ncbi:LysR Transcriptional regulator [Rhabdaerophilaceae bacterium]
MSGRPNMTLRQIEVVRAIMITGTIAGAAALLHVSAPGISRLMKYTERAMNLRLFERKQGRYVPTPEAEDIFEQINAIYKKVDDLHFTLSRISRGEAIELKLGSVPSISHVMVPRAVEKLRSLHPDLRLDINILKIEEAVDYILLGKGELAVMSYRLEHPGVDFLPLASGKLVCITPLGHPLSSKATVTAHDMAQYPLIGIDPNDPYGRIMSALFERDRIEFDMIIRARFGTTVCALVKAGLGIAIIDEFTIAYGSMPGIQVVPISYDMPFPTYVAVRKDRALSRYAENFIRLLRSEMVSLPQRHAPLGQTK